MTISLSCLASIVSAQTDTPTASASPTIAVSKDIINLKEKVADAVKKEDNKAVAGFVENKNKNTIKIMTDDGTEYAIKLDDTLTKYFQIIGNSKKEITSDDIGSNDYIIVSGVINDKSVTANSIFIDKNYLTFAGRVSNVDKDNYTVTVITNAKEEITLDIEDSTKQYILNIKTNAIEISGFSKIKEGDTIHFVVLKTSADKKDRYSAVKTFIIPQEYFQQ